MSAASDKILKQFIDLKNGLGKANDDDWKPRIRSIPIEVVKQ
jgi:hypothetical protein